MESEQQRPSEPQRTSTEDSPYDQNQRLVKLSTVCSYIMKSSTLRMHAALPSFCIHRATTAAAGARFCFQRDNQTLAARCERKHTLLIPRSAEHAHLVRTLPRELERAHVAPSVEEPKALRAVHVGKERD